MKYKPGDKFVITIGHGLNGTREICYLVNNSFYLCEDSLDSLEPYEDQKQEAYQRGLDDAWEAARKIANSPGKGGFPELYSIFKSYSSSDVLNGLKAAEAIEELSAQLLEMGQAGKFLLDAHKINCKMIDPDTIHTDSEWWAKYKALLELLYIPRWIPVTERLPGTGEIVLVYGKRGGIYTAAHNRSARCPGSFWKLNSKSHYCEPTHWMPLPEQPKEE